MAVVRINKNKNFTVMSNIHLKDKNLSMRGKGLLSVMLSLPDDWDYSISGLSAISMEGIKAIRSILNELEDAGYLVRTRTQNEKGQFDYIYDIYETPQPQDREPYALQGYAVQGHTAGGTQYNTNQSSTNELNTEKSNTDINEQSIFDYWNSKNIIKHQKLTTAIQKQLTKSIKEYGVDNLKEYIDRYAKVYHDTSYYFDTKWTLVEFLKQSNGISTFTDEGSKWLNYINRKGGSTNANNSKPVKLPSWIKSY